MDMEEKKRRNAMRSKHCIETEEKRDKNRGKRKEKKNKSSQHHQASSTI
jgi:hypothetical protein